MQVTTSSKSLINADSLLTNAVDALAVANSFASFIPVPVVSSLIQSAQTLVAVAQVGRWRTWMESDLSISLTFLVQLVQTNKKACARLANRAAELTQLISKEVHAREGLVDDDMRSAIASVNR